MNDTDILTAALILAVVLIPVACWFGIQIGYLRAMEDSTPEHIRENS